MSLPVAHTLIHPTHPAPSPRHLSLNAWIFGVVFSSLLCSTAAFSQAPVKPVISEKPAASTKVVSARPAWTELTHAQQQALAPLASSWNTISESQKRKWLEISKNYAALPPEEQAVLNSRMNEWAVLSPQQRAQARLNFGKTKELSRQLTPEEKNAKWQAYQALSPEEKQRLAAKASPKPKGAATAVKPVSTQKLATVRAHVPKPAPKIQSSTPAVLPPPAATPAAASTPGDVSAPSPR